MQEYMQGGVRVHVRMRVQGSRESKWRDRREEREKSKMMKGFGRSAERGAREARLQSAQEMTAEPGGHVAAVGPSQYRRGRWRGRLGVLRETVLEGGRVAGADRRRSVSNQSVSMIVRIVCCTRRGGGGRDWTRLRTGRWNLGLDN